MFSNPILGVTGHRPHYFDSIKTTKKHSVEILNFAITQLRHISPAKVITGMAIGWDMAVTCAAFRLDIPYIAAIPFEGQELQWSPEQQKLYYKLREAAEKEVVFGSSYSTFLYFKRDRWIVDNCDKLLALWNGEPKGGSYTTVQYAHHKNVSVKNVWNEYLEFLGVESENI